MRISYDWKSHYEDRLVVTETGEGYVRYRIANETGAGEVLAWDLLSGLQLIYNRLSMKRCA